MEHLALEFKNLNVQQLKKSENTSKRSYSRQRSSAVNHCSFKMSATNTEQQISSALQNAVALEDLGDQDFSSVSVSSEENSFESEEELEDVVDAKKTENCRVRGGVNVRQLRDRSVTQDLLHARNLRTSMKPSKNNPRTTEKLRPAEIKKLYTNKKLSKFRPTSLETIFEEPQPMRGGEQFRLVGAKKFRRALVCSDGLKTNKAVVNRRRARIKKNLLQRHTWKKIPLQNFLNYMQSSVSSDNEDDGSKNDKLESKESFSNQLGTVNEIDDSKMDLTDDVEVLSTSNKC